MGDAGEGDLVGGGSYGAICGVGDFDGGLLEWGVRGDEDFEGIWEGCRRGGRGCRFEQ